ncbi:metabolite traffic protein EboE [Photobacterium sp. CAU 1568]|uniref:Metabolite traffic protein EboE n=1 Tax=Photobacterium arenosum TaxID=2774143 RepID=A0ABR9BMH5_9GAMM|nr:metabolite traffic protein EboE [Photobacterium arenosum]MBD8513765.1 metabolite traffic protein EboE [Photobacterium arenosum]
MWRRSELTYCSNLHPGEQLADVEENLARYFSRVMARRALSEMASGLWLSAAAASTLQLPESLKAFRETLQRHGVVLTSLNGFPYGNFHQTKVKEAVYLPDWSEPDRLNYTCQLGVVLASCLPESVAQGTISTLPLGYRHRWSEEKQQRSIEQLLRLNAELAVLKELEGKHIMVCLEMEPDCVLETTSQLIAFFSALTAANGGYPAHLGVCFDVCHQGVMYEDSYDALRRITEAGITIGKIQISNAFEVDMQSLQDPVSDVHELLVEFAEARYLHQVKACRPDGKIIAVPDLSEALASMYMARTGLNDTTSWRVHFHIPLSFSSCIHPAIKPLHGTLNGVFQFLADYPDVVKPCLEVETYTWDVLPAALQPQDDDALIDGITGELHWLEQQLADRGLLHHD